MPENIFNDHWKLELCTYTNTTNNKECNRLCHKVNFKQLACMRPSSINKDWYLLELEYQEYSLKDRPESMEARTVSSPLHFHIDGCNVS